MGTKLEHMHSKKSCSSHRSSLTLKPRHAVANNDGAPFAAEDRTVSPTQLAKGYEPPPITYLDADHSEAATLTKTHDSRLTSTRHLPVAGCSSSWETQK